MYIPKRTQIDVDAHDDFDIQKDYEGLERDRESAVFLRRPSNTIRIEAAAQEYNFQALKLIAASNDETLDRDVILHNLAVQHKRNWGLLSLPFTLVFFFAFAWSAYQHEDITNRHVVESGLTTVLGKGASDITNVKDTWAWMKYVLFPLMFKQEESDGTPIDNKLDWSRVLNNNILVGPLFIEQERSTRELCTDKSGIAADMYCYSDKTQDTADFGLDINFPIPAPVNGEYAGGNVSVDKRNEYFDNPFHAIFEGSRRLRDMAPTYQERLSGGPLSAGIPENGVFRAMFYPNMKYNVIMDRLNYLIEKHWLDKQTKHIKIRALFMNADMAERPRLQSLILTLSYSRSGDVFRKMKMDTILLETWSGMSSMGADALFFVFLIGFSCAAVRSNWATLKDREFLQCMKTGRFWLQWITVVGGWVNLCGYMYLSLLLKPVLNDLEAINKAVVDDLPAEFNKFGPTFHANSATWVWFAGYLQLGVAQFHLALMMQFFVAFKAQPRLGVVVSTLEACIVDLFHFAVILIPTFTAYAISGCFIFGKRLDEFANIMSSMGFCFKILTETEYDWPSLSEEHFWTTGLWIWSFMIFLAMVMLNMVLAIVLDVYTEQRKRAGKSESIWHTIKSLWVIIRHRKKWIGTTKAMQSISLMPRLISIKDLQKNFPDMPDVQVRQIAEECQTTCANLHAGPDHMKHTMRMAMALKVAMDQVSVSINELDLGNYKPQAPVNGLAQDHWIREVMQELHCQNHEFLALQWKLQQLTWQWQAVDTAYGKNFTFDESNQYDQIAENEADAKII